MPKLEYPAYFEGGLLGIKCTEDIGFHEGFLYIPFKMIMSIEKAKKHEVLAKIIEENPDCFDKSQNGDWEQITLALFIFHEMTLGRNSYWYPYLRLMPDVEFSCQWEEKDKHETQDDQIIEELEDYKDEVEMEWHRFKKVLI